MQNRKDQMTMAPRRVMAVIGLTTYALAALAFTSPAVAGDQLQVSAEMLPAVLEIGVATNDKVRAERRVRGVATAEFVSETATEMETLESERNQREKRGRVMVW